MAKNKSGVLYWITGLYGSGKTTIGNALFYSLKTSGDNVVLLDGDILKYIVCDLPDYTKSDRKKRADKYAKLCKILTDQGLTVICCTISMFDDIRCWNRENNKGYMEIFLDVPLDVLKRRDQLDFYKFTNTVEELKEYQRPANPDIIIKNDGTISIEECVNTILDHKIQYSKNFDRDTNYWNNFYQSNPDIVQPSLFAQSIWRLLEKDARLLELGCGNGRDSIYFSTKVLVTAIDASDKAIDDLQANNRNNARINFICDDFVCASAIYKEQYDYCYSRFTIHSINDEQEVLMFNNVFNTLKRGGKFFIEVRSVNDEIYGKGEPAGGPNAFIYNGHYRRFIVKSDFETRLKKAGFEILYSEEKQGFAPFGSSNPPIIRVIAAKMETGKA